MDYPEFDPFRGGGGRQPQTQRVMPLGARLRAERIEKARRARERRVRFKMLLMLVALSFLLYATQSEWGRQHFSAPSMSVYIDGLSKALAGAQGNLIYFVLTIVVLFVRLPGSLMLIVGALAYGPIHGLLLGWSATILGTSATFLYGRRFSSKKCQSRLDDGYLAAAADAIGGGGFLDVAKVRFFYFLGAAVNWDLAGSDNVETGDYLAGNIVGATPLIVCIVLLVSQFKTITSYDDVMTPTVIIPFLFFVVAGFAIVMLRPQVFMREDG
ncbi:VTT domain-containing protein [bacterium]|nr:VTT domain-containing protein [bacterium]